MDCQHCGKTYSEISDFEAHSLWHTERQARLRRQPRKYSHNERRRSATTDQSAPSQSVGSAQWSPSSTTTVASPLLPSKRPNHGNTPITFTEHIIPHFDFNFATSSPLTPISSPPLPNQKTLDNVVARFPAFEIEHQDRSHANRDYKCTDCKAVFSSQKDCDLHNRSRFCLGSAAIAFALYRDIRQPGGYQIEKKYLPFNGKDSSVKCQKCHLSFSDRVMKKLHERSHAPAHIECFHCPKSFSTATEMESHYQWHDDMEYRHHRDRYRRKLPGLKLHTKTIPKPSSKAGVADFGRNAVLLANEDLTVIPEHSLGGINNFEPDVEIVAISFISSEDLERIHAPNGFFREVEPDYLRRENLTSNVSGALDALEGKLLKNRDSESSQRSMLSGEKGGSAGYSLNDEKQFGIASYRSCGLKKSRSLRCLFRRTQSEPELESNLKQRSSFRKTFRKFSISTPTVAFDGRLMLSALLHRVSTAANKGDLQTVRSECDRLMAMKPPICLSLDASMVPVQAFAYPEGTLVQDTAGNSRYISSETVTEITSALRHTPAANLAKTKVSVLSTRAYLSARDEAYEDAFCCYRQVLDLLREHPMLFPDVIWHAVILSNLAHLSARLNRPDDEERFYLKALAISYNRYGRRDLNNVNFLTALAAAYERNNQTTKAVEVCKRSLFARMEISGPGENDTLMLMQELAALYCKLGCLAVAKLLYEKCLGGFETRLGLAHKVTLLIVDRICDICIQLQAHGEALALYVRVFPHLRMVCAPDDELCRSWLSKYIQYTENYDFPHEVSEILESYRSNASGKGLWVLQSLARVYMLAGLIPDASEIFEFVYNVRRKSQSQDDPGALDALHGHCLALECMDNIDAAHAGYANLLQLAIRSAANNNKINNNNKDRRPRVMNVRARLGALEERKKVLADEQDAWSLNTMGPCGTCRQPTALLCPNCHISRFCSEACRHVARHLHSSACHPSVTLCESKSVTAAAGAPQRIEKQVMERLSYQNLRKGVKATLYRVSNSLTLSYDPRNLTTFRLKCNRGVDTYVSFDRDADIRFAVIDPDATAVVTHPESNTNTDTDTNSQASMPLHPPLLLDPDTSAPTLPRRTSSKPNPLAPTATTPPPPPPPIAVAAAAADPSHWTWTTPRLTPSLLLPKGQAAYLLVTAGEEMFRASVQKRRRVRGADSEGLEGLHVPDQALLRFQQGLVLKGVQRTRFAYLVEVVEVGGGSGSGSGNRGGRGKGGGKGKGGGGDGETGERGKERKGGRGSESEEGVNG